MLRRLCLYLLMACLALPAMAAPLHCSNATVEVSGYHGDHQERKAPAEKAQHDCIGCIAPFLAAALPAEADFVTPPSQQPHDEFLLARLTAGPDTPPPRG